MTVAKKRRWRKGNGGVAVTVTTETEAYRKRNNRSRFRRIAALAEPVEDFASPPVTVAVVTVQRQKDSVA